MDNPLEKPSETRSNVEKSLEAKPDLEKTIEAKLSPEKPLAVRPDPVKPSGTKPDLEKPSGSKKSSARLLEGKRVFIVEDDVTNLAIASVLLKQHGAEVGFERWGANTMNLLRLMAPVDIILLDLNLQHGVSGLDVYATIRQDEAFANVPIVAVSALDPSLAIPQTKKKGFSGFISKPVEFNLFAEQIAKVIDGGEVWYAV
jgi:CheY-like chemotaxis protein